MVLVIACIVVGGTVVGVPYESRDSHRPESVRSRGCTPVKSRLPVHGVHGVGVAVDIPQVETFHSRVWV